MAMMASVWTPQDDAAVLTVYVRLVKTGSSSMLSTLTGQSSACLIRPLVTGCNPAHVRFKTMHNCTGNAVLAPAEFGACRHAVGGNSRCRYFTLLREPLARRLSEYNYYCRGCAEFSMYCGRMANTSCPHLGFVEWVRRFDNPYTRMFMRPMSHANEHHCAQLHATGLAVNPSPVTESAYASAQAALRRQQA